MQYTVLQITIVCNVVRVQEMLKYVEIHYPHIVHLVQAYQSYGCLSWVPDMRVMALHIALKGLRKTSRQ